jgi:hypothetical protein
MHNFTDAVFIAGTKVREDGSLLADARIARTGIQLYHGSEVGKPDMAAVRVYRPGSEVFHADTMKSAAHRPVTNDHPRELVSADNWKSVAVGVTGDEIQGEGIYIRVPLMVSDGPTVRQIQEGKRELSAGYTCELDWTAGKTPGGEAYDAVQRNIKINHVAIVDSGRAGKEVRIGDDAFKWGASPVSTPLADERIPAMDLRTVLVDGLQVQTTDAGAQAIAKLQGDLTASAAKIASLTADHSTAIAAKDTELAKKDATIDDLKKKVVDGAALDALVAARSELVSTAKAIAKDVKVEGLSDADIRRATVVAKLGEAAVKDKAAAYIDARFDILAEDAKKAAPDAFRAAVAGGITPTNDANASNAGYQKMVADMEGAWQNPGKVN